MSLQQRFVVFGFASTHDALRAEEMLDGAQVSLAVIPTPRALGALCGLALRVPCAQARRAEDTLAAAGIEPTGRIEMLDR